MSSPCRARAACTTATSGVRQRSPLTLRRSSLPESAQPSVGGADGRRVFVAGAATGRPPRIDDILASGSPARGKRGTTEPLQPAISGPFPCADRVLTRDRHVDELLQPALLE